MLGNPLVRFREGWGGNLAEVPHLLDPAVRDCCRKGGRAKHRRQTVRPLLRGGEAAAYKQIPRYPSYGAAGEVNSWQQHTYD